MYGHDFTLHKIVYSPLFFNVYFLHACNEKLTSVKKHQGSVQDEQVGLFHCLLN